MRRTNKTKKGHIVVKEISLNDLKEKEIKNLHVLAFVFKIRNKDVIIPFQSKIVDYVCVDNKKELFAIKDCPINSLKDLFDSIEKLKEVKK